MVGEGALVPCLKHGRPVSSIDSTSATMASVYCLGVDERGVPGCCCAHLAARKAFTVCCMKYLNGSLFALPPMMLIISELSLKGATSKPMSPPGEVSNMKPKSARWCA